MASANAPEFIGEIVSNEKIYIFTEPSQVKLGSGGNAVIFKKSISYTQNGKRKNIALKNIRGPKWEPDDIDRFIKSVIASFIIEKTGRGDIKLLSKYHIVNFLGVVINTDNFPAVMDILRQNITPLIAHIPEGMQKMAIKSYSNLIYQSHSIPETSLYWLYETIHGPNLQQVMDAHNASGTDINYSYFGQNLFTILKILQQSKSMFLDGKTLSGAYHGDIKPSNIMFDTRTHTLKLIDTSTLNLVCQLQARHLNSLEYSTPHIPRGSPGYEPDEALQMYNPAGQLMPNILTKYLFAEDIFATGCVLYELVTRRKRNVREIKGKPFVKEEERDPTVWGMAPADMMEWRRHHLTMMANGDEIGFDFTDKEMWRELIEGMTKVNFNHRLSLDAANALFEKAIKEDSVCLAMADDTASLKAAFQAVRDAEAGAGAGIGAKPKSVTVVSKGEGGRRKFSRRFRSRKIYTRRR